VKHLYGLLFILGLALLAQGCVTGPQKPPEDLLTLSEAQMASRAYQTRVFDIGDEKEVLRGVMSALQDLGFIIERVNGPMGMVTAGKFDPRGMGLVSLTVVSRPKESTKSEIRVTALYNTKPIEDPKIYQNFFAAVGRALFGGQALAEAVASEAASPNPAAKTDLAEPVKDTSKRQ